MITPILAAEHLFVNYPDDKGGVLALKDVSLDVFPQEFVSVVGPSGCYKSTLLRVFGGLQAATAGQTFFDGEALSGPMRRIGMVFQDANLMHWRTVLDNITLPLQLQGVGRAGRDERARQLIDLVELTGFEASYPAQLSGGMAQRVAIARALIHNPDVLLLDEPFGALDALTRERMGLVLRRIWQTHPTTIVMVTHNIAEAVFLSHRVMVMSPRPGQVQAHINVTLPDERPLGIMHTPEFGVLASRVRAAIGVG